MSARDASGASRGEEIRELSIRGAREGDIGAVLGLWQRAGGAERTFPDSRAGVQRLLNADSESLLLAERDEMLAGSLIAAWDGWRGSFYRLAVDPLVRRQGIATALLRAGEQRLRALGAASLAAIVARDDPAALAFWERSGYARQGDRVRFISLRST